MSSYFCLSVTLHDSSFHGRRDDGVPEWPPSPLRAFQALVAAAAPRSERQFDPQDIAALEWLEGLDPPEVLAPIGRTASRAYRLYVPNNAGDLVTKAWAAGNTDSSIASHRTGKDVRPTRLVGGDAFTGGNTVRFVWRLPLSPPADLKDFVVRLSETARKLTHLGWGVDMAAGHAELVDEQKISEFLGDQRLVRWSPDDFGSPLRVPQLESVAGPGTFRSLVDRHYAFTRRMTGGKPRDVPPLTAFRVVGYRRAIDPPAPRFAAFSLLKPDASGFRPFNTARETMVVAAMMRHAAADLGTRALGWTAEKVASFVLGHSEAPGLPHQPVQGPRFAYVPLPSIEARDAGRARVVGSIRRALIVVQGGPGDDELRLLASRLSGVDLRREGADQPAALLSRIPDSDMVVKRYTTPASTWATVTPVILPGYDDPRKLRRRLPKSDDDPRIDAIEQKDVLNKLDKRIDGLLRKAIRQAGYSDELARYSEVDWRGSGFWPGTELATQYAFPEKLRRFRRLHVRITWRYASGQPIPVPGPICLGGGRFLGLGLFASFGETR